MKRLFLNLFLIITVINGNAQNAPTYYGVRTGTSGPGGSYFGYEAGHSALINNTSEASYNTFIGESSGRETRLGLGNTAVGYHTLREATNSFGNTAIGYKSMTASTLGAYNAAVGFSSLSNNTGGSNNAALGVSALYKNETGDGNVAIGFNALVYNIAGHENVAMGYTTLAFSQGSFNTAIGARSSWKNQTGTNNASTRYKSMYNNISGHYNSAFGVQSLINNETGSLNSAFGAFAGPAIGNLINTTALGYNAIPTASNQVRIGNTSVTSIGGKVSWSTFSDGRFKKEVKEDVPGLPFINKLRPVTYTLDERAIEQLLGVPDSLRTVESSSKGIARHTGFVAQEVEAVMKKTGYNFYGIQKPQNERDHYSIRYAEFVVPLVKAVQELSQEVELLKQQLAAAGKSTGLESGREAVLFQNNPNPFSGDTEIRMSLPDDSRNAILHVYNLEGKLLKRMTVNERGAVLLKISATEMGPGMYLYTLIVDGKIVDTKRMILTE